MRRKSTLLVTGILCFLLVSGPATSGIGDVILSFNAKAQNSTGLTWVNAYLWNIDHGHNVPAKLLKLDPSDGSLLSILTIPVEHVMGLTWDGNSFWVVSHEDSYIYDIDPSSGSILAGFRSPNPGTVETGCEGLAWDGQYLWYADSDFDTIYQLNPSDGAIINSFPTPDSEPQGLAWDGSYLWHFNRGTEIIYKLNSIDGSILTSFSAPGIGEGDLAWDGNYLWLSRNSADTIYKIDVGGPVPPVADAGGDQTVDEGDTVQFNGSGSYDNFGFIVSYEWDFDGNVDSDSDGNPMNDIDATDPMPTHIYGDNGIYDVVLTVTNNQNLSSTDICIVTVNNVAPTIEPFGPFVEDWNVLLIFTANATDPGSDDLTFTWNWGEGTSDTIVVHYNDGMGPDPYPSPWGVFPFNVTNIVQHIYDSDGVFTITLTVNDDDGGVTVYTTNITVISVALPTLHINKSLDGRDVILNWDPPSTPGVQYYLIYRSTSQIDFDFNTIWVNTLFDNESGEPGPIPLRTMWNDTDAGFPGNVTNYEEQYYYTIRAVNILGEVSSTSRTVGKWTKVFPKGVSTFSLPLKPLENMTIDYCLNDMNASYLKWMHPGLHRWMKHGDGGVNDTQMKQGEGYEVKFDNQTNYTFTGLPGAMISYDDDILFSGFDPDSEAKNLTVSVEPNGNVTLTWEEPASMAPGDWYVVYHSNTRDGFFGSPGIHYNLTCPAINFGTNTTTIAGLEANDPGARLYFMVVPFNALGIKGASTYSIGVWTEEYLNQYDTFGIPLKLSNYQTADWYCDKIPDAMGINYFIYSEQRWGWHSTRMPSRAYDPVLEMTEGYQISTSSATKFTFIGR